MLEKGLHSIKPKIKRKKRSYPEYVIQATLASLLRTHHPDLLWFAIPNGGNRNRNDGKRFKAMGVRAGVLDIFVSEPNLIYPGFYLEIKAPKGKLSDVQLVFKAQAEARGYLCSDTTDAIDGLKQIEEYMGFPVDKRVSFRLTA